MNGLRLAQEPGFQSQDITLAAGETRVMPGIGTQLKCSYASAPILVGFNDGAEVGLKTGRRWKMRPGEYFDRLSFRNNTGSSVSISVDISFGDIDDDPELSGEVSLLVSETLETVADVSITATTAVQVVAADSSRKSVTISNLSSNVQIMRIGDSNAGAARGVELSPGQSVTLETEAAVYAYNPGASAESLGVMVLS